LDSKYHTIAGKTKSVAGKTVPKNSRRGLASHNGNFEGTITAATAEEGTSKEENGKKMAAAAVAAPNKTFYELLRAADQPLKCPPRWWWCAKSVPSISICSIPFPSFPIPQFPALHFRIYSWCFCFGELFIFPYAFSHLQIPL
jgi:hypothetical protein